MITGIVEVVRRWWTAWTGRWLVQANGRVEGKRRRHVVVGIKQRLVMRRNREMGGIGMMELMELMVVEVVVVGFEAMRVGLRR